MFFIILCIFIILLELRVISKWNSVPRSVLKASIHGHNDDTLSHVVTVTSIWTSDSCASQLDGSWKVGLVCTSTEFWIHLSMQVYYSVSSIWLINLTLWPYIHKFGKLSNVHWTLSRLIPKYLVTQMKSELAVGTREVSTTLTHCIEVSKFMGQGLFHEANVHYGKWDSSLIQVPYSSTSSKLLLWRSICILFKWRESKLLIVF